MRSIFLSCHVLLKMKVCHWKKICSNQHFDIHSLCFQFIIMPINSYSINGNNGNSDIYGSLMNIEYDNVIEHFMCAFRKSLTYPALVSSPCVICYCVFCQYFNLNEKNWWFIIPTNYPIMILHNLLMLLVFAMETLGYKSKKSTKSLSLLLWLTIIFTSLLEMPVENWFKLLDI